MKTCLSKNKVFNEGKACDASIKHIEDRERNQRKNLTWPERDGLVAPIELTCEIGDTLFAFEHTGIEPFNNYIKSSIHTDKLFSPIKERLSNRLPKTESFVLYVPYRATDGLSITKLSTIQNALVKWIEETASFLPFKTRDYCSTHTENVTIPSVPFPVTLCRASLSKQNIARLAGNLNVHYYIINNDNIMKAERETRIRKACNKKFPKLSEWKKKRGARTVLVLEDNDISYTNQQIAADSFLKVESNVSDRPDEVYLVETCLKSLWFVNCIRCDAKTFNDFDFNDRSWEFDPTTLVDVMAK